MVSPKETMRSIGTLDRAIDELLVEIKQSEEKPTVYSNRERSRLLRNSPKAHCSNARKADIEGQQ